MAGSEATRALVATRKGLFSLQRDGGGTWQIAHVSFLGDNATMALADPRDGGKTVYVALGHGHFGVKMHRSDDGGATWKPIASPAYPQPPEGTPPRKDEFGRVIPDALQMVWALEVGGRDGELWCGTIPGGLFHSRDRGESWQLNETLWNDPQRLKWLGGGADYPGIHSICVHPQHPDHVAVAVSSGGVWFTTDAGKTWAPRCHGMRAAYVPPERIYDPVAQDPHRLVQCPSDPRALWVQHHNGIFRSLDEGMNWTELSPANVSTFGFATVVHPGKPDTAWFVPGIKDEQRIPANAKVIVSRTSDGGKTFDILNRGLPQQHAYDLVYRHALDIDASGTRLMFGSTTGSLWVSENGGDSWTTISNHLPPIYCVRMVG